MRFLKIGGVIFGALVLTTLGIGAADVFTNTNGSLLGQIIATQQEGGCPDGMIQVVVGQTFSCVDIYEASTGESCPIANPASNIQTQDNLNNLKCTAVSVKGKKPWTNIAREQAQAVCLRAGKRLPTAKEWYLFALGTPDTKESCNIKSNGAVESGVLEGCVSAVGVFDTIGNVWEWTDDDVAQQGYQNRILPNEGYVAQVAADGIATVTENVPNSQFGNDYFWSKEEGVFGLLRGGFYGSGEDAGVYAVQAKTPPTTATIAIGFRCVL